MASNFLFVLMCS